MLFKMKKLSFLLMLSVHFVVTSQLELEKLSMKNFWMSDAWNKPLPNEKEEKIILGPDSIDRSKEDKSLENFLKNAGWQEIHLGRKPEHQHNNMGEFHHEQHPEQPHENMEGVLHEQKPEHRHGSMRKFHHKQHPEHQHENTEGVLHEQKQEHGYGNMEEFYHEQHPEQQHENMEGGLHEHNHEHGYGNMEELYPEQHPEHQHENMEGGLHEHNHEHGYGNMEELYPEQHPEHQHENMEGGLHEHNHEHGYGNMEELYPEQHPEHQHENMEGGLHEQKHELGHENMEGIHREQKPEYKRENMVEFHSEQHRYENIEGSHPEQEPKHRHDNMEGIHSEQKPKHKMENPNKIHYGIKVHHEISHNAVGDTEQIYPKHEITFETVHVLNKVKKPPTIINEVHWAPWGRWSHCTASCDIGLQYRKRKCFPESHRCQLDQGQKRICVKKMCNAADKKPTLKILQGGVAKLRCYGWNIPKKDSGLVWITPYGKVVEASNKTKSRFHTEGNFLLVNPAQKTDNGLYHCSWPPYHTGAGIALKVETCESYPCKNNGNCMESFIDHSLLKKTICVCTHKYHGARCERLKSTHRKTGIIFIAIVVCTLLVTIMFLCCCIRRRKMMKQPEREVVELYLDFDHQQSRSVKKPEYIYRVKTYTELNNQDKEDEVKTYSLTELNKKDKEKVKIGNDKKKTKAK